MTPDNPRALPAEELANTVKKYNSHVQAAESLAAAVDLAYGKAEKEDAIVARFVILSGRDDPSGVEEDGQRGVRWKI